jgi:hypothetical protein
MSLRMMPPPLRALKAFGRDPSATMLLLVSPPQGRVGQRPLLHDKLTHQRPVPTSVTRSSNPSR